MGKATLYGVWGATGILCYMKKRTRTLFFSLMPDTYTGTEWKWELETWVLHAPLGCLFCWYPWIVWPHILQLSTVSWEHSLDLGHLGMSLSLDFTVVIFFSEYIFWDCLPETDYFSFFCLKSETFMYYATKATRQWTNTCHSPLPSYSPSSLKSQICFDLKNQHTCFVTWSRSRGI